MLYSIFVRNFTCQICERIYSLQYSNI